MTTYGNMVHTANEIGPGAAVDPYVVYIRNCRLSHPRLKDPASFQDQPGAPKKFQATFIWGLDEEFGQENMNRISQAVQTLKTNFWPGNPNVYLPDNRKCLRDGNTIRTQMGQERPECLGKWVLSTKSDVRPQLFDRNRVPVTPDDIQRIFYSGCRVDAFVRFFGVKDPSKGGNGIFCGLQGLRWRADDEAFGAAPIAPEMFEELEPAPGAMPGGQPGNLTSVF